MPKVNQPCAESTMSSRSKAEDSGAHAQWLLPTPEGSLEWNMFTKPKKPAPVDEEDLLFEIQDPLESPAAEAGVAEVRVGPGTIPLVFEDAGCGARVAAARAPLDADVGVGWRLVAVNGIDVAGVGADGVRAVLEKRSSEDRKLRFETGEAEALEKVEIAVDGATIVNLGLDFDAAAKPAVVAAVAAESPLAGRVAVGAKLVSIDGIDLTALHWAECEKASFPASPELVKPKKNSPPCIGLRAPGQGDAQRLRAPVPHAAAAADAPGLRDVRAGRRRALRRRAAARVGVDLGLGARHRVRRDRRRRVAPRLVRRARPTKPARARVGRRREDAPEPLGRRPRAGARDARRAGAALRTL